MPKLEKATELIVGVPEATGGTFPPQVTPLPVTSFHRAMTTPSPGLAPRPPTSTSEPVQTM